MILGGESIEDRLNAGEIFQKDSWVKSSIKEASYALRVDTKRMVVGGQIYEPKGNVYSRPFIEIEPGSIAILSTVEKFCMPGDLVGKLGIRLYYASKGLTGLMGIQVDPFYGRDDTKKGCTYERLYIKVANFGNETVRFSRTETVFNIEFSEVKKAKYLPKTPTWDRIKESLANQENSDWTYMTRVNHNAKEDVNSVRQSQQSVVLFGVFLVSITILVAMLALIFSVENAPNWVTDWGWKLLIGLFIMAALSISFFVVVTGLAFLKTSGLLGKRE